MPRASRERIWKLAMPKAKAKAKAKPKAKAKAKAPEVVEAPEALRAFQPCGRPAGGRASAAWPLSGGRYPKELFAEAQAECVVGWAKFHFDLATESRSAQRQAQGAPKRLKPGPLRERILEITGRA